MKRILRLGLLGSDDATLEIAAAAESSRASVVLIDGAAQRLAEARSVAPAARVVSDWEALLDTQQVDAVLLAADKPSERIEQLRRLMQVGMPTIVSHPLSLSMLEGYELDMIREETHAIVLPYLPARWHPAANELRAIFENSETSVIGAVEQIVLERFMPAREREAVLRQFARDADLLQFVAGDATKLHASGSSSESAGGPYANLAIQLTCDDGMVCRWTVSPSHQFTGGRLMLVGSSGRAVLSMPTADKGWTLDLQTSGSAALKDYPHWSPAATTLRMLSAAIAGSDVEPNWTEACRTVELAETIDRSLKRGRTIDLHHEEFTDIGTFKGTMTSVGCALLMIGLMLVVCVALGQVIAVQAGWNRMAEILGAWPYLLLGVCGIYLLLQFLLLVGGSRETNAAKTDRG
jgi:predicted dehydrogenase